MSEAIARIQPAAVGVFTPEQRDLIKRTVAPGATDDELAMFLHVAQRSGLDPLRKQIHFTKMGGRIAFIADVNGLQARAAKETDFEGLLHAVVYEKDDFQVDNKSGEVAKHSNNPLGSNGRIVGAWATVRRKGMLPFTAVVRFEEYNNGSNPLWKSKPGVMIDKVAKSTALRLAYPEQLGGIYDRAELDTPTDDEVTPAPTNQRTATVKAQVVAKAAEVVDAKPVQQALPEFTNPYARLLSTMKERGVEMKQWAPELKRMTSKTKPSQVTDEDVDKVVGFFFPEPPPLTEADAPPPEEEADIA